MAGAWVERPVQLPRRGTGPMAKPALWTSPCILAVDMGLLNDDEITRDLCVGGGGQGTLPGAGS